MAELFIELFSEEIPARMQKQAAADLDRLVTSALIERGLKFEGAVAHATPRRLALHVAGLPPRFSALPLANLPNSIIRVFSADSSNPNLASRTLTSLNTNSASLRYCVHTTKSSQYRMS